MYKWSTAARAREMSERINLTEDSKQFLRFWREQYEWPIGTGRKASEKEIFELLDKTRNAILR